VIPLITFTAISGALRDRPTARPVKVPAVVAQQASNDSGVVLPSQLNLDAPSAAALDVLGVSPSKAKSLTNLQDAVLGIVNSFDENGHLKQGFAYNDHVYRLGKFDAEKMLNNPMERVVRMTNLSLAATLGSGDDKSSRAAFAVSIPIVDNTDWRFNANARKDWDAKMLAEFDRQTLSRFSPAAPVYGQVVRLSKRLSAYVTELAELPQAKLDAAKLKADDIKNLKAAAEKFALQIPSDAAHPTYLSAQPNALKADLAGPALDTFKELEKLYGLVLDKRDQFDVARLNKDAAGFDKLIDTYNGTHWNARKIDLSYAYAFFSPSAQDNAIKGEGSYVWLTWAEPLGSGQLTAFGRYASRDRSWDKDAKTWSLVNNRQFGARYRFGTQNGGMFVEYLQKVDEPAGKARSIGQVFQGGYEAKLSNGNWLQIAFGQGSGGFSRTIIGMKFSFGISADRKLDANGKPVPAKEEASMNIE